MLYLQEEKYIKYLKAQTKEKADVCATSCFDILSIIFKSFDF